MEEYEDVRVTDLAVEIETTYISKIKKFIFQISDESKIIKRFQTLMTQVHQDVQVRIFSNQS